MGIELAKAYIIVRADASHVAPDVNAARPGVESAVANLSSSFSPLLGILAKIASAAAMIKSLFTAGTYEQTEIAFGTMIGSAKETRKTLEALTEFAAKTPFEMPEILQAARGLIMFGERGDELIDTLNILGNAAAGASAEFGTVALIFNQVRGVGRLLTQDFRQLSTRGVMSLQDIAKYYKVTTAEAQKMLSSGKISFNDLRGILKMLSGEGGRFHNMMEAQSRSFLGMLSTLKDNVGIISRMIGMVFLPVGKKMLEFLIGFTGSIRTWVEENKELVRTLGKVVALMLAWKAATIAVAMATKIAAGWAILLHMLSGVGTGRMVAKLTLATGIFVVLSRVMDMANRKAQSFLDTLGDVAKKGKDDIDEMVKGVEGAMASGGSDKSAENMINMWERVSRELFYAKNNFDDMQKEIWEFGETGPKPAIFEAFKRGVYQTAMVTGFNKANKELGELGVKLSQAQRGLTQNQIAIDEYARGIGVAAWQVRAYADRMASLERVDNFNKMKKSVEDLRLEVFALSNGWTDAQKELYKYSITPGVTQQQLLDYRNLINAQKEFQRVSDLKKDAEQMKEKLRTPMEEYQDEVNKVGEMVRRGFLTEDMGRRSLVDARKKMLKSDESIVGRMGVLDFGKKIQDMLLKKDKQEQMLNAQKQANNLLAAGNQKAGEMVAAIRNQPRGLQ